MYSVTFIQYTSFYLGKRCYQIGILKKNLISQRRLQCCSCDVMLMDILVYLTTPSNLVIGHSSIGMIWWTNFQKLCFLLCNIKCLFMKTKKTVSRLNSLHLLSRNFCNAKAVIWCRVKSKRTFENSKSRKPFLKSRVRI